MSKQCIPIKRSAHTSCKRRVYQ